MNITADPEIFPVTPQTVMNLIMSSAVGAKAAREELGIDDAAINKIFQALILEPLTDSTGAGASDLHSGGRGSEAGLADITSTRPAPKTTIAARGPGGLETATLRIGVTLPNDVKPAAEEFLRATVDNLRLALRVAGDGYISQLHEMAAKAQDQRLGAQEELRKAMSEAGLEAEADVQDLTITRRGLEKELESGRMELALMKTRQEAIVKQIDLLRAETAARMKDDVVTQELQKLVQSSESSVQDMEKRAAAGMVPNGEVTKALENLARARIDLARRQGELNKAIGGGQLDSYSGELSQMAIQTAEREARIRLLEEQRNRVRQTTGRSCRQGLHPVPVAGPHCAGPGRRPGSADQRAPHPAGDAPTACRDGHWRELSRTPCTGSSRSPYQE